MTSLQEIISYTDQLLCLSNYSDASLNGLQVQACASDCDIKHLGAAVDSGESVLVTATQRGVDLLFVHHGLFWGACRPITGPLARKLQTLFTNRCSLYCAHLPLDGHATIGNGALLARLLGLTITGPVTDGRQPVGVFATVGQQTRLPEKGTVDSDSCSDSSSNSGRREEDTRSRDDGPKEAVVDREAASAPDPLADVPLSLGKLDLMNQGSKDAGLGNQGVTLEEIVRRVQAALVSGRAASASTPPPYVLPFGPKRITSVAIVSGSGSSLVERCADHGIDLFISGEPKQEVYHLVKELGINAIFAGHYATETLGVRALVSHLSEKFGVTHEFIDEETGI